MISMIMLYARSAESCVPVTSTSRGCLQGDGELQGRVRQAALDTTMLCQRKPCNAQGTSSGSASQLNLSCADAVENCWCSVLLTPQGSSG